MKSNKYSEMLQALIYLFENYQLCLYKLVSKFLNSNHLNELKDLLRSKLNLCQSVF